MAKLTNTLRDTIVQKALDMSPLTKQRAKLLKQQYAVSERIRVHALGGKKKAEELQAINDDMTKLASDQPSELKDLFSTCNLTRRHGIRISIGGQFRFADFGYKDNNNVIYRISLNGVGLSVDHPLAIKHVALHDQLSDIKDKIDDLRIEIQAVVYNLNSTKQLIELWPEAAELIPFVHGINRKLLPAIQVTTLNAAIGLPA